MSSRHHAPRFEVYHRSPESGKFYFHRVFDDHEFTMRCIDHWCDNMGMKHEDFRVDSFYPKPDDIVNVIQHGVPIGRLRYETAVEIHGVKPSGVVFVLEEAA